MKLPTHKEMDELRDAMPAGAARDFATAFNRFAKMTEDLNKHRNNPWMLKQIAADVNSAITGAAEVAKRQIGNDRRIAEHLLAEARKIARKTLKRSRSLDSTPNGNRKVGR